MQMICGEDETQLTCDLITESGERFSQQLLSSDFATIPKFKGILNKKTMKQEFEEKEAVLRDDISKLEEESRAMENGIDSSNPAFEAFRKHRSITEINRGIMTELIRAVYIHEGGEIDIDFAFSDETARAAEFIEANRAAVNS